MNKGVQCPYGEGNSHTPYKCQLLEDRCLFQKWCVIDHIYKFTDTSRVCKARAKKSEEDRAGV